MNAHKSLKHAGDILNLYSSDTYELGVTEIARKLQISMANVSRLTRTMESMGMLIKNTKTRKYLLGSKLLELAHVYLSTLNLKTVAQRYMKELNENTNELITLVTLRNSQCTLVDWIESKRSIRQVIGDEKSLHPPIYALAPGKLLLSYFSEHEIDGILAKLTFIKHTDHTINDKTALKNQLIEIRNNGLAISYGELLQHTFAVSAPIFDWTEKAVAAITISWLKLDDKPEYINEHSQLVKNVALKFSKDMGYKFFAQIKTRVR